MQTPSTIILMLQQISGTRNVRQSKKKTKNIQNNCNDHDKMIDQAHVDYQLQLRAVSQQSAYYCIG